MKRNFKEAIEHRRTYYSISNSSPISDGEIEDIVKFAVKNVPSAFNSQSTRVILLLGKNHQKLWDITKSSLKENTKEASYTKAKEKIDNCFTPGYGTVLFFEDKKVVKNLQENFPLYSDKFPTWSQQTSAMHQFAIWTMLEDAGFGASLQHYNSLIDKDVINEWKLDDEWELVAQMPFGMPLEEPSEKEFSPLEKRVLVFK